MAVVTRIYWNGGSGPVDYSTPLASVTGTSYVHAVPASADAVFAARRYDTVSGLEERNVDARWRVRTGPAGEDLTAVPGPAAGLSAYRGPAGTVVVRWGYPHVAKRISGGTGLTDLMGRGPLPTGFRVYGAVTPLTLPATPAAVVAFVAGVETYQTLLTGFPAGAVVEVCVKPYNGVGESPAEPRARAAVSAGPPAAVVPVASAAVP